jgi:predicted nucleotidyltransferase component of viral defense system
MDESRLNHWEALFAKALGVLRDADRAGLALQWSFGGGTALMLRYAHRISTDIDIFVPDPQWLPSLSPRLNEAAEALGADFVEDAQFLKFRLPEGEIDFVASGWLTSKPFASRVVLGSEVNVETPAEIVGKKLWFRADRFRARDLYDLATVIELEPAAMEAIRHLLEQRGEAVIERMASRRTELVEEFNALELLHHERDFDRCVEVVCGALKLR